MITYADHERGPCTCAECAQAGVSEQPQKRDPRSGKWLHGYDLKRLYDAQARFWETFRAQVATKGMK